MIRHQQQGSNWLYRLTSLVASLYYMSNNPAVADQMSFVSRDGNVTKSHQTSNVQSSNNAITTGTAVAMITLVLLFIMVSFVSFIRRRSSRNTPSGDWKILDDLELSQRRHVPSYQLNDSSSGNFPSPDNIVSFTDGIHTGNNTVSYPDGVHTGNNVVSYPDSVNTGNNIVSFPDGVHTENNIVSYPESVHTGNTSYLNDDSCSSAHSESFSRNLSINSFITIPRLPDAPPSLGDVPKFRTDSDTWDKYLETMNNPEKFNEAVYHMGRTRYSPHSSRG